MNLTKKCKTFFEAPLPGKLKFARLISVVTFVIILFIAILYIPVFRGLVIVNKKTGDILYCTKVKPGDTYTITYTHSINKSPVDDVFEIQQDYSIMLKKTVFRAFGVGIPSETVGDQVMNIFDDRIEIDNINMPVKEHLVFVGLIADHRFTVHNQQIHLNKLIEPQQTVQFEVRRLPIYMLMRRD